MKQGIYDHFHPDEKAFRRSGGGMDRAVRTAA